MVVKTEPNISLSQLSDIGRQSYVFMIFNMCYQPAWPLITSETAQLQTHAHLCSNQLISWTSERAGVGSTTKTEKSSKSGGLW